MFPLLVLGAAGFGLYYFLTHRTPGSSKPIDVSEIPGAAKPISAPSLVKGRSGVTWLVQQVEAPVAAGVVVMDVILNDPNIPARPHMVIRFAAPSSNPVARSLVGVGPSTPDLIAKAKADFGIEERQPGSRAVSTSGFR